MENFKIYLFYSRFNSAFKSFSDFAFQQIEGFFRRRQK